MILEDYTLIFIFIDYIVCIITLIRKGVSYEGYFR